MKGKKLNLRTGRARSELQEDGKGENGEKTGRARTLTQEDGRGEDGERTRTERARLGTRTMETTEPYK